MTQVEYALEKGSVKVTESTDIHEIKEVLNKVLYVPDTRIKPKVIKVLCDYLLSRFSEPEYKLKVFIATSNNDPCGFIVSDLNPEYKSYGRKCGTFGWLHAPNFEVCKNLLKYTEEFVKEQKLRRLRGPINFPKNEMGFGLQVEGFEEQLLHGVAFHDPNSPLSSYLNNLSYIAESEYTCLRVDKESWKKGNALDRHLKLACVPLDELMEKTDEIVDLALDSFSSLLPDTSGGGRQNVLELIKLAIQVPKTYFTYQPCDNLFHKYRHIPEFIEAWKEADLENMVTVFPMVLERKTNKLVGMLIGVLDYYQYWNDEYISRVNVHTAMVRKGYSGKGVFSSLNNFGQTTNRAMTGLTYYEGTAVWTGSSKGINNTQAINTIFPHCTPIRKHIVFEKRIR